MLEDFGIELLKALHRTSVAAQEPATVDSKEDHQGCCDKQRDQMRFQQAPERSLVFVSTVLRGHWKILSGGDDSDENRRKGKDDKEAWKTENVELETFFGVDADHVEVL